VTIAPARIVPAAAGAGLLLWGLLTASAPPADAQDPLHPDSRYAGLQWTFARVKYTAWNVPASHGCDSFNECWTIDYPAAEQNLTRRLRTVTSIQVNEPVVVSLDEPALWTLPWIYLVEPGTMRLKDGEVENLREFLLRGGTLTFDDFHGPIEWAHFEREMRRVFPNRPIVDLPPDHPVFHCFYQIDEYPQTPGLGSFLSGRTWEKGGFAPRLRAIEDDNGRAMVLINFNTDMGDGWEWSNAADYPGYVRFTAQAYRMQINEIIYSLTH
jgi:hypothetical protein